ncbi:Na/Pi symporter [Clostridium sp. AM58-1XD]|uniref:Na/Pi cotransporter family protein n=1 Tax=Clostridium sp. AM58-1XD TaxID=2292307 RepID=UPI00269F26C6
MMPLRYSQGFVNLMTRFTNPLLGIAAGAVFTAIIQSSSASVGILQALAVSGLIGLDSAVFVLFGQNIGTCITAVLASVGTNRSAKRATLIHLMFNIIGTTVFVAVCLVTPFTDWIVSWIPDNPAAQIANVHTIFNITTTLLLLPFGTQLAEAAVKILPDRPVKAADEQKWFDELLSSDHVLGISVIARKQLKEEIAQMARLAADNVEQGFLALEAGNLSEIERLRRQEDEIDLMNAGISRKISKVLAVENSPSEVNALYHMLSIVGNVERISDHAMNLSDYAQLLKEKGLELSEKAKVETGQMRKRCMTAIRLLNNAEHIAPAVLIEYAGEIEQEIDNTTVAYRQNQIRRMGAGDCDVEASILYSEILTDYERIGDHILNIAAAYAGMEGENKAAVTAV